MPNKASRVECQFEWADLLSISYMFEKQHFFCFPHFNSAQLFPAKFVPSESEKFFFCFRTLSTQPQQRNVKANPPSISHSTDFQSSLYLEPNRARHT